MVGVNGYISVCIYCQKIEVELFVIDGFYQIVDDIDVVFCGKLVQVFL